MDEIPLTIQQFNSKGKGVGTFRRSLHAEPSSVAVFSALPGDELLVELGRKRRGAYEGRLKEVVKPSEWRIAPRCRHVPECGGCSWQQMRYEAQLAHKEAGIERAFAPLLTEREVQLRPILPCPHPWHYRNKMEFSFSQNKAGELFLGLMIAGAKGRVFNLEECHLSAGWFARVLHAVRLWWKEEGLTAYRMNDTGVLRTLTLREGSRTGDKMALLTVSGNPAYPIAQSQLASFVKAVRAALPGEKRVSIFLRVHQLQKGHPTQFYEMHLHGPDHIQEILTIDTGSRRATLTFKISPTSFFQPHSAQAEVLYSQALQMLSFPKRHVWDLYAGTATFSMAMALEAEKVTAIELNPYAVFDAESNRESNGITNLDILCGDVGAKVVELRAQEGFVPPDLIVVDPPRTGLDSRALQLLIALNVPEILYISCNPATQALNIRELVSAGYALVALQPVDQFPHTVHVENIALLKKRA